MRFTKEYFSAGLILILAACANKPPAAGPDYTHELGSCAFEQMPYHWIEACTARIDSDPLNDNAFRFRGYAYWHAGELDRALDDVEHALALDPNDWENHHALGMLTMYRYDFSGAVVPLETAIRLEPSSAFSRRALAENLIYLGEFDRAAELIQENLKLEDTYDDASEELLCQALVAGSRTSEAESVCESITEMHNRDDLGLAAAAYYALRSGAYDQARSRYTYTLRRYPTFDQTFYKWNRARLLYEISINFRYQGDEATADRELARARELDPRIDERMALIPFTPVPSE